jgi:hypothetical protein
VCRGSHGEQEDRYRLAGADQRVVRQLVDARLVLPPIMSTLANVIRRAYERLVTSANLLQSPLLLALRLYGSGGCFYQLEEKTRNGI